MDRIERAVAMRQHGDSWCAIGAVLGYSGEGIRKAVLRERGMVATRPRRWRVQEAMRLRAAGMPWIAIAAELGYADDASAWGSVWDYRKRGSR